MYRGADVIVFAHSRDSIEHWSFHADGPRVCVLNLFWSWGGEMRRDCLVQQSETKTLQKNGAGKKQRKTHILYPEIMGQRCASKTGTTVQQAALFPLSVVTVMHHVVHC